MDNRWKLLTLFEKNSIIDIWRGPIYASELASELASTGNYRVL